MSQVGQLEMTNLKEIYLDCQSYEARHLRCPVETEIAIFCLNYLQLDSVRINLVCSEENSAVCTIPEEAFGSFDIKIVTEPLEEFCPKVAACKRPSAISKKGHIFMYHSGLCMVMRLAVKAAHKNHPEKKFNELLGYHENFLKACAEVSVWTKFCEVTLPQRIESFLSRTDLLENETCALIEELVMLENNFKQPVKVSNVGKYRYKKYNELKDSKDCDVESYRDVVLDHDWAEASGTEMSLADLILYPCVHEYLASSPWIPPAVCTHLSGVYGWYERMSAMEDVREAATRCDFRKLVFDVVCQSSIDVPVSNIAIRDVEKPKKRIKTKVEDVQPILQKLQGAGIQPDICDHPCIDDLKLDWPSLPDALHPVKGDLPQSRVERKCEQLENMVKAVCSIAKPGDRVVDFCSGGGHVGIILAYLLPKCQILLIENKEQSLQRAENRIRELELSNVDMYQSNLDYYNGDFDIGLCLHACGIATDMVLQKCINRNASFVICPCCYGRICDTIGMTFPRSSAFRDAGVSNQEHMTLGRGADQTETKIFQAKQGKYCMQLVDTDRSFYAQQHGYQVKLCSLIPLSCTPKNNLLIGTKL